MKLYRYSHRTPNFEDFNRMTKELEEFIRSDFSDEWPERLAEIQRFQTEDGGFAYVDDWRIESDARVEFCYKPTYHHSFRRYFHSYVIEIRLQN